METLARDRLINELLRGETPVPEWVRNAPALGDPDVFAVRVLVEANEGLDATMTLVLVLFGLGVSPSHKLLNGIADVAEYAVEQHDENVLAGYLRMLASEELRDVLAVTR